MLIQETEEAIQHRQQTIPSRSCEDCPQPQQAINSREGTTKRTRKHINYTENHCEDNNDDEDIHGDGDSGGDSDNTPLAPISIQNNQQFSSGRFLENIIHTKLPICDGINHPRYKVINLSSGSIDREWFSKDKLKQLLSWVPHPPVADQHFKYVREQFHNVFTLYPIFRNLA